MIGFCDIDVIAEEENVSEGNRLTWSLCIAMSDRAEMPFAARSGGGDLDVIQRLAKKGS